MYWKLSRTYVKKFLDRAIDYLKYLPDIEAKKDFQFILNLQLQRKA